VPVNPTMDDQIALAAALRLANTPTSKISPSQTPCTKKKHH
jgi:hypothetical protein